MSVAYRARAMLRYAHMAQAGDKPPWEIWQQVCALALCTTSPLLFLFASLCLATGIVHHERTHQAH
jgi:hypothetical protein